MISLVTPCPIIFKMNIMPILSILKSDFLQYRVFFHEGPQALSEKKTLYCKKYDFQMDNTGIIFILKIIGQGVTNEIISIFNMLLYQPIGEL